MSIHHNAAGRHAAIEGDRVNGQWFRKVHLDRLVCCIGELLNEMIPGGFKTTVHRVPSSQVEEAGLKGDSAGRTVLLVDRRR